MKLKSFTKDTLPGSRKAPSININASNGMFSISQTASDIYKIEGGVKIKFLQDEEKPKDWYFTTTKEEDGFSVRASDKAGLIFNSKAMAAEIFNSLGAKETALSFLLGESAIHEKQTLIPIITASGKKLRGSK